MKKIIIVYDNVEEYQLAYRKYTADGFNVSVCVGIELALCIQGDEVAWLSIVKAEKYLIEKYGW